MTRRSLFRGALAALGLSAFRSSDVQVDWMPTVVAEADDVVWATSNSHGWQFFTVLCRPNGKWELQFDDGHTKAVLDILDDEEAAWPP